jgi:DNA-3-methyladenine glycosylase
MAPDQLLARPPTDEAGLRELVAAEVIEAAIGLIGCRLITPAATLTIVETEAYHQGEPACHGYGGHTPRAEKLRRPAGFAYVYLSYGIHSLVNVVTGSQSVASAVLIRGAIREVTGPDAQGTVGVPGPGRVGTALAIDLGDDGVDLLAGGAVRLEPAGDDLDVAGRAIAVGPRVGITKAVDLPWRFALDGSSGVSSPRLTVR